MIANPRALTTPHLSLRFKFYKIALVVDIEKAFYQILICPSDRDMLQF